MIVCKKTDEWYIEWHQRQRVIKNDNEWYSEWQGVVQRVTASGIASDNKWQRITTSKKKWQWVTANDSES